MTLKLSRGKRCTCVLIATTHKRFCGSFKISDSNIGHMRIYIILHLYVMHRMISDDNLSNIITFIIYQRGIAYRYTIHNIRMFRETIDEYARKYSACVRWTSCVKLGLQTTFLRAASLHWIFRTCITSVSICSYASASGTTSFMLYVDGMGGAVPRAFNNGAARNKGKICKMIRVANSIASELEDWMRSPAKENDIKQRKHEEGGKQSTWLKP